MKSKGIAYRKDLHRDEKICLIEGAKLVITSDLLIQKRMDAGSIPNIFLDFKSGRSPFIRWRFLENPGRRHLETADRRLLKTDKRNFPYIS